MIESWEFERDASSTPQGINKEALQLYEAAQVNRFDPDTDSSGGPRRRLFNDLRSRRAGGPRPVYDYFHSARRNRSHSRGIFLRFLRHPWVTVLQFSCYVELGDLQFEIFCKLAAGEWI